MNRRRVIQIVLLLAAAWGVWKCWQQVQEDPILSLIFFLFVGAAAGLWVVKVVLPWFAESIGTSIYMSGGKMLPDEESSHEEKASSEDKAPSATEVSETQKEPPVE